MFLNRLLLISASLTLYFGMIFFLLQTLTEAEEKEDNAVASPLVYEEPLEIFVCQEMECLKD